MIPLKFLLYDKTVGRFLAGQSLQLGIFFVVWFFFFPQSFMGQLSKGPALIFGAFLFSHLMWCLFEFFFHRYILHMSAVPWHVLLEMEKKHTAHHNLTPVRKEEVEGKLRIYNDFPILKEEQRKHSAFPWYALVTFLAIGTPAVCAMQFLFPALPMLLAGYLSIFVSYTAYEVIHGFEHRSYEDWWKPRIEHPRYGTLFERIYGFHLTHHVQPRSNESVAGFLGLPLADWLFGTYKRTSVLMLHGAMPQPEDFVAPQGIWLIRTLDRFLRHQNPPSRAN